MEMGRFKKHTPEGAEDCLPRECYLKKEIEARLRGVFLSHGFFEVETPAFEYYDVFSSGVGSYLQEKMIKFFDAEGRILVLKPDHTVPIARMYNAYYAEGASQQRFFYIQNAYSFEQTAYGKSSEYTQAGIELIGEKGCGADAEVIYIAVQALKAAGLKDFKVDIGQVGFFKALINGAGLEESAIDEIRHNIDIKNLFDLDNVLKNSGVEEDLRARLNRLPMLFGGEEVFTAADAVCTSEGCREALKNLRDVYALLCAYGIRDYISIDLGMLHDIGYYSGIIFRGLASGIGFPVISGGRYDNLLAEFGAPMPATGFAMGIKRIMIALEKQGLLQGDVSVDYVVGAEAGAVVAAHEFSEKLRREGKRVLFCTDGGFFAAADLKKQANALKGCYFDGESRRIEIE